MDSNKEILVNLIMKTMKEFRDLIDLSPKPCNLKHSEAMLMFKLKKYLKETKQEKAKTTDISKILELSPSTITPTINSLEEKGYIQRSFDIKDRRVVFIEFTEKGVELEKTINKQFKQGITDIINHLGEEDTNELMRLLNKLIKFSKQKEEEEN